MNESLKAQYQRPEGALIERAMKRPPKTSGRRLANDIEMSEGRIRQIVNGYKTEAGMVLPVIAPAETLARIGAALDLTPEEFEETGRLDAANILRGDITSGITEEGDLWIADNDHHRVALLEWLNGQIESDPPEGPLMLWDMDALLRAVGRKHRDEMAFLNSLVTLFRSRRGGDGDAEEPRGAAPMKPRPGNDLHEDVAAYNPDDEGKP